MSEVSKIFPLNRKLTLEIKQVCKLAYSVSIQLNYILPARLTKLL